MTEDAPSRDLLVLVADADMEQVMHGVLSRVDRMDACGLDFDVQRHTGRDAGCRTSAATFLRPFLRRFRHCMVVFDRHGCGSNESREDIQRTVEQDLARNGWRDRAKAIVIDPELEAWIWGDLKVTAAHVGWPDGHVALLKKLRSLGSWPSGRDKPADPKEAMLHAMSGSPLRPPPRRSPRIFRDIAESAQWNGCRDAAFNEFRDTLRSWFPAGPHHE